MTVFKNLVRVLLCFMLHIEKSKNDLIAQTKCWEYAEAVYVEEMGPVLSLRAAMSKVSSCGIVAVPLIVGGIEAKVKEFPHMAVVGYGESPDSKISWMCGGSLISEQHILTAAHCLDGPHPPQVVRLGLTHLTDFDGYMQERRIAKITVHPDYHPPLKYNDIAIFHLDKPVQFSAYVRPACLDTLPNITFPNGLAAGFGTLSHEEHAMSPKLMKVDLNTIATDKCSEYIEDPESLPQKIAPSMMCAGVIEGGKDTCQGDSGGPLQVILNEPYCMYSIIGVTSFGRFCGYAYSPAIYTRVSYYVSWIEDVVWGSK